jgi:hypothetical protein
MPNDESNQWRCLHDVTPILVAIVTPHQLERNRVEVIVRPQQGREIRPDPALVEEG